MSRLALPLAVLLPAIAFAQADAGAGRPRVAVLYFQAATTDPELTAFTKGVASLLISELANHDQIEVVERERLEDVMKELKLGETQYADKKNFEKIGNILGAQYLVTGFISAYKDKIELSAHLTRPGTTSVPFGGGARVKVKGDDVFGATDEIGKQLFEALLKAGVPAPTASAPVKTGKLPLSTAKKWAKALNAKDQKDPETAKKLLGEVVKEQPDFKLAQLDLLSLTR